jgi:hypothetical protein
MSMVAPMMPFMCCAPTPYPSIPDRCPSYSTPPPPAQQSKRGEYDMPAKFRDDDDQPATEADAEVVDDERLREAAGGQAWSDAVDYVGDDEPESHPWSVVTGQAAVLIGGCRGGSDHRDGGMAGAAR